MHVSSLENMRRCRSTYVDESFRSTRAVVSVVDVGSADVNGSYRTLFPKPDFEYLGVDIAPGPGVDLVIDDPYRLPLPDASADLVLSGQMLEHCEFFWLCFGEMVRILKPDGYLFLIAPSAGPEHRYPVDCYRFYSDAYRALAKHAGCHLVDVWQDDKGPWNDLTGVFSRRPTVPRPRVIGELSRSELQAAKEPSEPGTPAEERVAGELDTLHLLQRIHDTLRPSLYLEIGVRRGDSLSLAHGRAVAIDPRPDPEFVPAEQVTLHKTTSDDYFESAAASELGRSVDFAFIDGMHLAEFALRDFIHLESHAAPWAVIAIDDIFPNHPAQASRTRRTRVWTGDVWRMVECLEKHRPDLLILKVSSHRTGLALVAGLDPDSMILLARYNPILAELRAGESAVPDASVLARRGALQPDHSSLRAFLSTMASLRKKRSPTVEVRSALQAWRAKYR
jgi:hypothetical protein